jgi:Delta7-sterol 5-desaturase
MISDEFLNKWMSISQYITFRYFIIAGITFLLFYFILKIPFQNRRIQTKFPKSTDYGRDILYSLFTVLVFATMATIVFWGVFPYTNMYRDISEYGMVYYWLTIILMFFIHDTYFYWMHRLMHSPKLFKYVHLIHHKSTNPSPWTSYAFHPFEAVIEAGIIPLIAFTLPVHPSALVLFLLMQFIYNVYGHLGYELFPKNFHKSWIGRWINTGTAHNLHHKHFTGNYGLYFLIWDRALGTLRDNYDSEYEKVTDKNLMDNVNFKKQKPVL